MAHRYQGLLGVSLATLNKIALDSKYLVCAEQGTKKVHSHKHTGKQAHRHTKSPIQKLRSGRFLQCYHCFCILEPRCVYNTGSILVSVGDLCSCTVTVFNRSQKLQWLPFVNTDQCLINTHTGLLKREMAFLLNLASSNR